MSYTVWKSAVEALIKANLYLELKDVGFDEENRLRSFFDANETPEEVIRWLADKYDLDIIEE